MVVHQQEFEIRELAICTIGRLSGLNPAYIMPSLRKTLIQVHVFYAIMYSYGQFSKLNLYSISLDLTSLFNKGFF